MGNSDHSGTGNSGKGANGFRQKNEKNSLMKNLFYCV